MLKTPQQSSPLTPTTTEASGEEKRALACGMEPHFLSEQRLGRKFLYLEDTQDAPLSVPTTICLFF